MKKDNVNRFSYTWLFWVFVGSVVLTIGGYFLISSTVKDTAGDDDAYSPSGSVELMTSDIETIIVDESDVPIPSTTASTADVDTLPVFSFTPEEWVDTLGTLNGDIGLPAVTFDDVDMKHTIFTLYQSTYVLYMGRMNTKGEVYTVMLGGFGDGTDTSGYEITLSMAIFIASLHPEYTPGESGAVIGELGLLGESYPDKATLTKDGTLYEFVNDPEYGVLLFASPTE